MAKSESVGNIGIIDHISLVFVRYPVISTSVLTIILLIAYYSWRYKRKKQKGTTTEFTVAELGAIAVALALVLVNLFSFVFGPSTEAYMSIVGVLLEMFALWAIYWILEGFTRRTVGKKWRKVSSSLVTFRFIVGGLFAVTALLAAADTFGVWDSANKMATFAFFGLLIGASAGVWMPDVYAGMAMVLSRYIGEGDVVEIKEKGIFGEVHRVGVVFSVIRDIPSSHFVVVRNTVLRDSRVDNLSKPTKPSGIRERILFKIGYRDESGNPMTIKRVYAYFDNAADRVAAVERVLDRQLFEWYLEETGDFALHYAVFYRVPADEVKRRLEIRAKILEVFYDCSIEEGIDLSTPVIAQEICPHPATLGKSGEES